MWHITPLSCCLRTPTLQGKKKSQKTPPNPTLWLTFEKVFFRNTINKHSKKPHTREFFEELESWTELSRHLEIDGNRYYLWALQVTWVLTLWRHLFRTWNGYFMITAESHWMTEVISQSQFFMDNQPLISQHAGNRTCFYLIFKMWLSATMKHETVGGQNHELLVKTTAHSRQNCNEGL